jgi:Tfp pilus assembly protein PilX
MASRQTQEGMVLIAVLVVLVVALLAGMGALQTVTTGNAMSGNFSFRQTAMQASDRALTDAMSDLATRVTTGTTNNVEANRYLNVIDPAVNTMGMPTAINWSSVRCLDEKGALVNNCDSEGGKFRVQYVVERRCQANPLLSSLVDIRTKCEYEPQATAGSPQTIALRYRVMIRVRGPRGTENWFDAMISGPATT